MKFISLSSFFLLSIFLPVTGISQQCSVSAGNDLTVCQFASKTITATANPGVATFTWNTIPASAPITGNPFSIPSNTVGTVTYEVTAGFSNGCAAKDTVVVTVIANPKADFSFTPNNSCATAPVGFTNLSSGTGLTYNWNFGDPGSGSSNSSTAINPVHLFNPNPGNGTQDFVVTLIATNVSGCSDTIKKNVTVKQLPGSQLGGTGSVTYNGLSYFKVCASSSSANFNFTNQTSTQGTNTNYKIVWGDNSPDFTSVSYFPTVTHTYNVGTYNLLFIVSGANGCIDTGRYNVFVGSNPAVGLNNPGNTNICSGSALTFPISGTASNTIGTTYTVTFNDGSAPVVFSHPPPADVTHNFAITSCGTTSSDGSNTYPNSFSAVIVASNPCGTSSSSVVPIYVSQKPAASFSVSPKDTVCTGTTVTINNTSLNGSTVDNGICTPGKPIWAITPATGWSLSSGTAGNDFGQTDPSLWIAGTNTIQLNFSTAGTYTIKLKTGGNTTCGLDSIIKTICVNPLPVANFTIDQNIGCAPLNVNTTNLTTTPNCGINKYNWSITYTPTAGCTPNTAGYSFTNGTNANSINPSFQFTNPGVYTINLIAIAPASACSSLVVSKQVTVKGKPTATITAPASVCVNQSINPSVTASCYAATAAYAWSFPGGNPANASTQNPDSITYNTIGNYNISVDVTNECGTTNVTKPISITDVTTANAGPAQTLCGSSITLAGNTPVLGTGLWSLVSGPNNPVITNPALPNTTVTGLIAGVYTFKWTITNGSCISSSTVMITISAGPSIANAGPDQGFCLANIVTLAGNTPVTGTGSWSLVSGPNTPSITSPASPNTTVTGLIPGVYIFKWSISFSNCTPSTDNVQVTIFDNPSTANAGADQVICSSTTTLNGSTPSNGTGQWALISGPNTPAISLPSSATTNVSGLISGTYLFKWTISNGNCPPSIDTVQIFVTAVPTTPNAGPDQSICNASSATLSGNNPVIGTGAWTQVSGPNTAVITNPASPSTTITGLIVGTYLFSWTINNGNCPPVSDNVQITINGNATPAYAGSPQTVCSNTATLNGNTPVVGTGSWSLVSGPNTPGINNPASSSTIVTGLITGTYTFKWTITNGSCSSSADVTITVSGTPTAANAGPDQALCFSNSVNLNANSPVTGTGLWEQVSGPAGATIANTATASTSVTNLTAGTYTFTWKVSNSVCPPSLDTINVVNYDTIKNHINTTPVTLCSGQTVTVTGFAPSGGNGTYSYQWQQSSDGVNWSNIPGAITSNLSYLVNNSVYIRRLVSSIPCNGNSEVIFISVQPGVNNNTLSGAQQICTGNDVGVITGSQPTGGDGNYGYQWQQSLDGGLTWTNIPNEIAKDYSPGILTQSVCYRRQVSSALCSGPQTNNSPAFCITVNPDAKASFTFNKDTSCAPFSLQIQNTSPINRNGVYNWYANNNLIGAGQSFPGYTINQVSTSVTIKMVAVSAYGCKNDSLQHTFYTKPKPVPAFTVSDTAGCGPLTVLFTNNTALIDTFKYQWNFGNGLISNNKQPGAVTFNSSPFFNDTIYKVTLKAYSECDTVTKQINIKVYANAKARFNVARLFGCSPFKDTIINTSQGGAYDYYWDFGDGKRDTTHTTGKFLHTYNTSVIDTFTVTLIAVNQCGRDTQSINVVVVPNTINAQVNTNASQLYGCSPHTVTFNNSSTGATDVLWDFGDNSPVITTPNIQTLVTHTYNSAGTFNVSITFRNDCTDTTVYRKITVYQPPVADFILLRDMVCEKETVIVTNESQYANAYEWIWGDGTLPVSSQNASHVYASPGTYAIQLVAKSLNNFGVTCIDTSAVKMVTVVAKIPAVIQINSGPSTCIPYSMNVQTVGAGKASKIEWVFYDDAVPPGISSSTGFTATHIYNTPGIYKVKLIVTDSAGCSDSLVKSFTIYDKPIPKFIPVNVKTCNTDTTITLSTAIDYNGNDPVSYTWLVNDVVAGNTNPFTYHFHVSSNSPVVTVFNIKLLVTNKVGCGDTVSFGKIIIQRLLSADISVLPSLIQRQPDYTFEFKDLTDRGPNFTFLWEPGDKYGASYTTRTVKHTYGDTGTYKMRLTVTDYETGCITKGSVRVTILYVPGYLYVPNAFYPNSNEAKIRTFLPVGSGLQYYRLQIYDSWGTLLFETHSLTNDGVPNEPWDGTYKGKPLPQDAYIWKIEAKFKNKKNWDGMIYGNNSPRTIGTITLFR